MGTREECGELDERLEEAIIDKEIAEERCEQLQNEIKRLNLRIKELETDYDSLKTEMEGSEGHEAAVSSVQVKSLEEKNKRLYEGLLKMRDVASDHATRKGEAEKEIERLRTANAELGDQAETALCLLKQKDDTIAKLQEQVDALLASEQMIETLTERNHTLEDQITRLEEEIEELDSMNSVNEELFEAAKAVEKALRMEVDREVTANTELRAVIAARDNKILDLNKAIRKYRSKVEELDRKEIAEDQCEQLHDEITRLNQRIQELETGYDSVETDSEENEAESVEVQSLEEQNKQLQEELLKMRDLASDHDARRTAAETELERLRNQDAIEAKGLRWQIEKKEEEIVELKTAIRSKNEDLTMFKLRLDLANKKAESVTKKDDAKCQRLQQKVDDLVAHVSMIKTDYERTLDHLQNDLCLLEKENAELKKKSKSIWSRVLLSGVEDSCDPDSSTVTSGIHILAIKELEKVQGRTTRQLLEEMPELHLPNVVSGAYGLKEKRRDDIDSEVEQLRRELLNLDLESQRLFLNVGPTKQKDKKLHDAMVAEHNARCEDIKFRCARLWKKCRPGETLPVLLEINDSPKTDDTTTEDILSKWEQEVKESLESKV